LRVDAVRSSFEKLDRDGDGYISVEDLHQVPLFVAANVPVVEPAPQTVTMSYATWCTAGASAFGYQKCCCLIASCQGGRSSLWPSDWAVPGC
jgi:hypothetical protein